MIEPLRGSEELEPGSPLAAVVPALVVLMAVLAVLLWRFRGGHDEQLIGRYRACLVRALKSRDYALAYVAARRMEQLTGYTPASRFATARILEARGRAASAHQIMEELAAGPGGGYPLAHLWLAKRILAQPGGGLGSTGPARFLPDQGPDGPEFWVVQLIDRAEPLPGQRPGDGESLLTSGEGEGDGDGDGDGGGGAGGRPGRLHGGLELARRHLERVVEGGASGAGGLAVGTTALDGGGGDPVEQGRRLLAVVYCRLGQPQKAIAALETVADLRPADMYWLALLHLRAGNWAMSRFWARRLERLINVTSKGELAGVIWRARALAMQERFDRAVAVLAGAGRAGGGHDGDADGRGQAVREAALSELYYRWAERTRGQRPPDRGRYVQLLVLALQHWPVYPPTYGRVVELTAASGGPGDSIEERLLADVQASVPAGPAVELLLGNLAWAAGRRRDAVRHYAAAVQFGPQAAALADRLAWAMAGGGGGPAQLDAALELTNVLLRARPQVARFQATRGCILARMQRWEQAVGDLERAKAGGVATGRLLRALAAAYDAIGMASKAARAKARAWEIERAECAKTLAAIVGPQGKRTASY